MANKTKKSGPLTSTEKVTIAENFRSSTTAELSKKLNRSEATIQKYIDKLLANEPKEEENLKNLLEMPAPRFVYICSL